MDDESFDALMRDLFRKYEEQSVGSVYIADPDAANRLECLKKFFSAKNSERCHYEFFDFDHDSDKLFGQKFGGIAAVGEDESIDIRAREWAEIAAICGDRISISIYQGAYGHLRLQYYIENYWRKIGEI